MPMNRASAGKMWIRKLSGAAPGNGLVGVTPDAPDLKWSNRGRVAVTLKPDEVKEIKVVVPSKAFRL